MSTPLPACLKLSSEEIKVVKETKVLGNLFHRELTFIPRIKAHKALDVKVVASTDWVPSCQVFLQLYRALVRSKLDYGSIVYGSARPSYLKELNTIHSRGLRICLGAYWTSPINSLLVEANEYSLADRCLKLSIQYAVKLYYTPPNPADIDLSFISQNLFQIILLGSSNQTYIWSFLCSKRRIQMILHISILRWETSILHIWHYLQMKPRVVIE